MSCKHTDTDHYTDKSCQVDIGRGCAFCTCGEEISASACTGCYKLNATDWLEGMPERFPDDIFEVRFKNTRKSYFRNVNNLPLKRGDIVAVEASPGHDIGIVSLTGDLVARQMKRVGFSPLGGEFKKIYRKAKPYDIEKWQEAIAMEHSTMIQSRQLAAELGLNMKIGDVEYQGDKIKTIFYYIADERVDFRELIKIFAEQFRTRVEMKQIGARQEAGRIGGLGSCGRELCCASWISSFVSVTTNSARHQEISLNPQKLAGQCGKLKCCLVYELDTYLDARKDLPHVHQPLQALDGDYYLVKTDILSRTMWFGTDPHSLAGMRPLGVERVKEIIRINQKGQKVDQLEDARIEIKEEEPTFANVVGEESLTRFDKQTSSRRKNTRPGGTRSGETRGGERAERGANRPEGKERVRETSASVGGGRTERAERGRTRSEGKERVREVSAPVENRERTNENTQSASPEKDQANRARRSANGRDGAPRPSGSRNGTPRRTPRPQGDQPQRVSSGERSPGDNTKTPNEPQSEKVTQDTTHTPREGRSRRGGRNRGGRRGSGGGSGSTGGGENSGGGAE